MKYLTTQQLKSMFISGVKEVEKQYKYIDQLNVFPIPDGDTGTNLKITLNGACKNIETLTQDNISVLTKSFANGLLMNARGNSGVIFSQIFYGLANSFSKLEDKVEISDFVSGFASASIYAYKSVSNPVEGTILTIIRLVSKKLDEMKTNFKTIEEMFRLICIEANEILKTTPNYLPQLKKANVVDSGAYGLTKFFEGMFSSLILKKNEEKPIGKDESTTIKDINLTNEITNDKLDYGYCCTFILNLGSKIIKKQQNKDEFNEQTFKSELNDLGNSIVYARIGDLVKVHIHVLVLYKLLKYVTKFGELDKIEITNMTYQIKKSNPDVFTNGNENIPWISKYFLSNAICTVVPSVKKIVELYAKKLQITDFIKWEQKITPSVHEIYLLMKKCSAQAIIFVTCKSDLVMPVKQAIKLLKGEKAKIKLIPATNISTNFLVCLGFNHNFSFIKNYHTMNKIFKNTYFGQIFKSNRESKYGKIDVKVNDFIAICNNKNILTINNDFFEVAKQLVNRLLKLVWKGSNMVIFCDSLIKDSDISKLKRYIAKKTSIKPSIIMVTNLYCCLDIAVTKK